MRCAKLPLAATAIVATLLLAEPAAAFRCGNKLVSDGMHEAQVIAVCGQPTSIRNLGVALRSYDYHHARYTGPGWTAYTRPGFGSFAAEVVITEYVYNFGPRKLMRRLIFEGGVLATIETIGYGYRE